MTINFSSLMNNGIEESQKKRVNKKKNQHERRRDMMQERINANEREMKMREMEDKRIENIREEIMRIKDSDMSNELKNINEAMLNDQINKIYMERAEREQLAIDREIQRQQQEMDERMRERERELAEKEKNSVRSNEDTEVRQYSSAMKNFVMMDTRRENISSLKTTRASLSAAATRIRGEADFDSRRQTIANQQIVSHAIKNGTGVSFLFDHSPLPTDGFKWKHLQKLNEGISNLSANINQQVSALYKDSQKMQEQQVRLSREKNNEQPDDEDEYRSIDLRL